MKFKIQSSKFDAQRRGAPCGASGLGFAFGIFSFAALASGGPITPVEDLARRADDIVHGTVASLECRRDGAGRIFTRVELDVAETWKGAATNRFALVQGGGVLGDRWTKVSGGPEFRLGEEVVVFTVRNSRGEAVTLDLAQGKFLVLSDSHGGERHVSNGLIGGAAGGAGYRLPTQLPLSLVELRQRAEGGSR